MSDAESQLYETVRKKFEQDGTISEVECLLQSKLVAMMRGSSHGKPMVQMAKMPDQQDDGDLRIVYLNQLILEYLHWHGFKYTAEMFAAESNSPNVAPIRECLEGVLGKFAEKDIPILLQSVDHFIEKHKRQPKHKELSDQYN